MERVAFLIEDSNQRLSALLNPEGLVIRRAAGVRARRSVTGQITGASFTDDPLLFTGGGTTELEIGLLFDVSLGESSISTEDVRQLTRPIWNLAENLPTVDNYSQPPLIRFLWGKSWNVLAIVVAVAERLEYFTQNGVPRRSWLRLRLIRVNETARRDRIRRRFAPVTPDFWDLGYPVAPSAGPGVHQIIGGGPRPSGPAGGTSRGAGGPISWSGRSASEIVAIGLTRTPFTETLSESTNSIRLAADSISIELDALEGDPASNPNVQQIKGTAGRIESSLEELENKQGIDLIEAIGPAAQAILSLVQDAGSQIEDAAEDILEESSRRVKGALLECTSAVEALYEAGKSAVNSIKETSAEAMASSLERIDSAVNQLQSGLSAIATTLSQAASELVEEFEGVLVEISSAVEKLSGEGEIPLLPEVLALKDRVASVLAGLSSQAEGRVIDYLIEVGNAMNSALVDLGEAAIATWSVISRDSAEIVMVRAAEICQLIDGMVTRGEAVDFEAARSGISSIQYEMASMKLGVEEGLLQPVLDAISSLQMNIEQLESSGAIPEGSYSSNVPDVIRSALDEIIAREQRAVADMIQSAQRSIPLESGTAGQSASPAPGTGEASPNFGERLDQIAFRYLGDPARWRAIAQLNSIEDPLRMLPGLRLQIPEQFQSAR